MDKQNLQEVKRLLEGALHHVNMALKNSDEDYAEGACWRVADALGMLGETFPEAIGIKSITGRQYQLGRKQAEQTVHVEFKAWDRPVTEYSVFIKGTALWLGTYSSFKRAEQRARQEVSNYPNGERVIYVRYPHWVKLVREVAR